MIDSEENIEDYFNNKLNEPDKRLFEERCVRDEAFAQSVAFYVMSREAVRQKLLEQKKRQWTNDEDVNNRDVKNNFKLLTLRKWLPYVAAACLLFLVGLYFFTPSTTPRDLADNYFRDHLSKLSQTMNASKDSLQQGIAAYNRGDYRTALSLFEGLHRSHPDQSEPIKFTGDVYLATKNYDKALSYFDKLSLLEGKYSNPGMFLKAVTLLLRDSPGDKVLAKQLLEKVVSKQEEGAKTANEILKKW